MAFVKRIKIQRRLGTTFLSSLHRAVDINSITPIAWPLRKDDTWIWLEKITVFFLQQLYYYYSFLHEMSERRACEEILSRRVSFISCAMFCRCLSLSLCLPLCVSVFMRCVTLRVLIANRMVTDSSCRGGIVNIRDVCSCALSKAPQSSKAFGGFV